MSRQGAYSSLHAERGHSPGFERGAGRAPIKRRRSPKTRKWPLHPSEYGGELRKTRLGRAKPRPLDTSKSMHVVLRSSKARGEWSFRRANNYKMIRSLVEKFSAMYEVKMLSMANVGNHLHMHVRLTSDAGYMAFIRALSGAIAMFVTGRKRGFFMTNPGAEKLRFWDNRPYSRIVHSYRYFENLRDYVAINQLEGQGVSCETARMIIEVDRKTDGSPADFG